MSFFVDRPSNGEGKPIYRRVVHPELSVIFDYKNPAFDPTAQRRAGTYARPSMYFDPGWSDWNENTLKTNLEAGSHLDRAESISIRHIQNPIMAPGGDDIFLDTFRRIPNPNRTAEVGEKKPFYNSKYLTIGRDGALQFRLPGIK